MKKEKIEAGDKALLLKLLDKQYPKKKRPAKTKLEKVRELKNIQQQEGEQPRDYYDQANKILLAAGGRDHDPNGEELTSAEIALLALAAEKFIEGIHDERLNAKATSRYLQETKTEQESLKRAFDCMERCISVIKSKNISEQKIKDKAREVRLHAFDRAIQEFETTGTNSPQGLAAFQTTMGSIGVPAGVWASTNQRPRLPTRIRSNERIQDVTNVTDSGHGHTSTGLQHCSGYSPQDPRTYQSVTALPAPPATTNNMQLPYRSQEYYQSRNLRADMEFNPKAHSNSFINGSVIYDYKTHGPCCHS